MNTALNEALWTAVSVVVNQVMGWVMVAAAPVLGIFLAVMTGLYIWNGIMKWHDEDGLDPERVKYEESGASQEARDYWESREDGIDM